MMLAASVHPHTRHRCTHRRPHTRMTDLPLITTLNARESAAHVSSQRHAMAGATIALSAAAACALGEACVGISRLHHDLEVDHATAVRTADRLAAIRQRLLSLADQDGSAITAFVALREAGRELEGQDLLCHLPLEMGRLAAEAAALLQDFRPLVRVVQDDLEMALTLLAGAARAASLLLDSNLRLWPDPALLGLHEPALADLRAQLQDLRPAERIRS